MRANSNRHLGADELAVDVQKVTDTGKPDACEVKPGGPNSGSDQVQPTL